MGLSSQPVLPGARLDWLDAGRATAWVRTLAAIMAVGAVAWVALSWGGLDPAGKPLGTDFLSYWSASRVVLSGAPPSAVYDPLIHGAVQATAFPAATSGYAPFPYPPTFLLICLPLGLAPYLPALALWLGTTGYAYVRVVRAWAPAAPGYLLPVLAFPAVLINLAHGQNAFLTTALFGGGLLLLGRRDVLAGLCLGALAFKPHLGVLIPLVLIASRNWRALAAAAVAFVVLHLASLVLLGPDIWRALPAQLATQRQIVESGLLDPRKLQSAFGALWALGAPLPVAYAVQGVVALGAGLVAGLIAWRRPASPGLGPVLVAATLLVSPYLLDYDLLLAAIPLVWMLAQGRNDGFRSWEKAVLLAAFVLPLVSRLAAMQANLPLAPFVLAALLAVTARRAWSDGTPRAP